MKTIKSGTNSKGIKYALCWKYKEVVDSQNYIIQTEEKIYSVWKLCENYDGKARGGVSKSWRFVENNLTLEQATKLYDRRIK